MLPSVSANVDGNAPRPRGRGRGRVSPGTVRGMAQVGEGLSQPHGGGSTPAQTATTQRPMPLGPERFLNRELSWLDFNTRVLALAEDRSLPLLERAKFLAIFSRNLDEFFQVRVAGLKDQLAAGVVAKSADGLDPRQQLDAINRVAERLLLDHARCFTHDVQPRRRRRRRADRRVARRPGQGAAAAAALRAADRR